MAHVKESFADPIFRLKGHKGPQMKVDGSRSKKFPDILAVSMEGTGRPLGFVWTTDLKGSWQKELGDHIMGLMEKNIAPDPQRFLAWKEDRTWPDAEYVESCIYAHPYLREDDYLNKIILQGTFQRQTCQDIMYAGNIVVGEWRHSSNASSPGLVTEDPGAKKIGGDDQDKGSSQVGDRVCQKVSVSPPEELMARLSEATVKGAEGLPAPEPVSYTHLRAHET